MPAEARLERDVSRTTGRGDLYKILVAFLLMAAPGLVYIALALG